MSGRRMSGTSRLSLGYEGFPLCSFIFEGKSHFKESVGIQMEVPDIFLTDISDQPKVNIHGWELGNYSANYQFA